MIIMCIFCVYNLDKNAKIDISMFFYLLNNLIMDIQYLFILFDNLITNKCCNIINLIDNIMNLLITIQSLILVCMAGGLSGCTLAKCNLCRRIFDCK